MKVNLTVFFILIFFYKSAAQDYIPMTSSGRNSASCILSYSFKPGANRPSASLYFADGFELNLNATCSEVGSDGTNYQWCVRNDEMEEVAYLSIRFKSNKALAEIKYLSNKNSNRYSRYLKLLNGTFKKI